MGRALLKRKKVRELIQEDDVVERDIRDKLDGS
jgi:hypothetical protein